MSTPSELPPRQPSKIVLATIPLALILVAALETSRIPAAELFADTERPLQTFFLALRSSLTLLWLPLLYHLYVAALLAWPRLGRLRFAIPLAAGLAALAVGWLWSVLAQYPPLGAYPPLWVLLGALWAYLTTWTLWLQGALRGARPGLRKLARWAFPALGLLGFAATSTLNRTLFLEAYPTLHESMLGVAYLLLHAGIAGAWLSRRPARRARPIWRWGAAVLLAHLVILSFPLAQGGWTDPARPAFRRYTDLGRAQARRRRPARTPLAAKSPRSKPAVAAVDLFTDPDALRRFRKYSHLPPLPPGFRLEKHNLLLITVEALRFRETDLHGEGLGLTPQLAAFAQTGCYWFTRAYSPAPGTLQSMSSVFTATYPSFAPLRMQTRWHGRLDARATTVAEELRRAGYRTFYAGHNFKEHFSPGGRIQGLHQGFAEINLAPGKRRDRRDPQLDTKVLALAIDALDRHRKKKEPFFGWIFFESPHYPYLDRYPDMPGESALQRYRQEIRFVDERLGELFDYLDLYHLREKTVILLFADHGEAFGEHRRRGHADVYSEVTRVPLVISIPGVKGRRIDGPTSLTYLFPWLFLRGGKHLRAFAKERLRHHLGPLMRSTGGAVLSEMRCPGCGRASLVYPTHRVILDLPSDYVELYDLRTDPQERRNRFDLRSPLSRRYQKRLDEYLLLRAAAGAIPTQPRERIRRARSSSSRTR